MPYNYITDTGVIVPDTSVTLAEVQTEYRNALGQDLNLDPNTPQGQLITAEVGARNSVLRNNADLANQLNPNRATGVHLRDIGQLMGINDTPVVRSVCLDCVVTGNPNSLFPVGSRAVNRDGAAFLSIQDIILDNTGKGTVNFQSEIPGPIQAPANTLTPAQPIPGWSEVRNPTDAIVGSDSMTDYQFRVFRQNTLARQSNNAARSIHSKVSEVFGVRSLVVRENDEATAQTIDGVAMEPNSIWICVNDDGGISSDIAQAILSAKPPGCKLTLSTNSAGTPVTQQVIDEVTGQLYTIRFTRSIPRPVYVRMYVRNNGNMSNLNAAVVDAVLAYAAGEIDNEQGLVVGADVSPFTISGSVVAEIPGTFVRLCQVSTDAVTWQTTQIDIAAWQRATLPRGNITVIVE